MPARSHTCFGIPIRTPARRSVVGSSTASVKSTVVESLTSRPAMIEYSSAASRTFLATGPIWSRLEANATMPKRETVP